MMVVIKDIFNVLFQQVYQLDSLILWQPVGKFHISVLHRCRNTLTK